MKICVVCHEATLTGAPRIGFDIAAHLERNHDVTLITKRDGPLIECPEYDRLRVNYRSVNTHHALSRSPYWERVNHALMLFKSLRPKIVYVNSLAAGDWCEAARRSGALVVLHTHELRESLVTLRRVGVYKKDILSYVDLLVGASRQTIADLLQLSPVRFCNTLDFGVIVNVKKLLSQRFVAVNPAQNACGDLLSGQRPTVTMCGVAAHRKGPDLFVEVAFRLPQYDFLWIGPWHPSETAANTKAYKQYKQRDLPNLYVTGLTDNPSAYLDKAQLFLLTSREDPNPLVIPEALLLGKKVVGFSKSGDSRMWLERFGYALSGSPSVERMVRIIPKLLSSHIPPWMESVPDRVRDLVDAPRKLEMLETTLCNLATPESRRDGATA